MSMAVLGNQSRFIDINADAGESYGRWKLGDDEALLPLLSSVNIACGFHAGDPVTIRRTLDLAAINGLAVGAHVSYPDLAGFGRREMTVSAAELEADLLYQIAALDGLARVAGMSISYVKPHGALFHRTLTDQMQGGAVAAALAAWPSPLMLLTSPTGAAGVAAADRGIAVASEAFAERGYQANGLLIPRGQPGDLIHEPHLAAEQAVRLARTGSFDSVCIHGDSPNAVTVARAVREELIEAGFAISRFAADPT